MEVIFHGIFILFKLAILGSIYAILTLLIFRLIGNIKPTSWADRISQKKLKFWFITGALISVGLLIFSTTHWGSHGLGDSAIIPLQHGKVIKQINGTQAYIDVKYEYGNLWIGEFAKASDFVLGKTKVSPVDDPENFFVWDLKSNNVEYFETKEEIQEYTATNNLPEPEQFKEFWEHYEDFWMGWRFWTLL